MCIPSIKIGFVDYFTEFSAEKHLFKQLYPIAWISVIKQHK